MKFTSPAVFLGLFVFWAVAAKIAVAAPAAALDDTAKVLAGLPPSSGSPLETVTAEAGWKNAAAQFAPTWNRFEERQLARARAWADRELAAVRREAPVLFYTFSGPDILYANTFFPDCQTYVLCGLEPAGQVPDLLSLPPRKLGEALRRLHGSLDTVLALSFFKTKDMGSDFRNTLLPGTTPVLLTFLARLGKTVRSAELIAVDREGHELRREPSGAAAGEGSDLTPGVKINFDAGPGTAEQTLYYFTADISDKGLARNPGFANFCRQLEPGAGFVKAASYLLHTAPFASTRDFLMERCKFILQDDTGIPAAVFTNSQWQVRPYGRYVSPIQMFRGYYQKELARIYADGDGQPLDFGVGYHYRVNECNMILAARDADSVVVAWMPPPAETPEPDPASEPAMVVAANETAEPSLSPRKKLIQLEAEELRIRKDASLTRAERMRKLREIWKQQLEAMGKTAA
jgi:hypothetical protein